MNHARPEDDRLNLRDLEEAEAAVKTAETALRDALADGPRPVELFFDCVGVALSRLARVWSRISTDGPPQ